MIIKTRNSLFLLSVITIIIFATTAYSVTYGSDVAVSRFDAAILIAGSPNDIVGFTWVNGGFTLMDALTEINWDAVFPVNGALSFNGGKLILDKDLVLASNVSLNGPGTIDAQGNSLILKGDLNITSHLSFIGMTTIDGQGHTLDLSDANAELSIDNAGFVLHLKNMVITGLSATKISRIAAAGINFENCTIYLDGDFACDGFNMTGNNIVRTNGWTFNVNGGLNLSANTTCEFDVGSVIRYTTGNITFADRSSVLKLNNSAFDVDDDLVMIKGTLVYDGDIFVDIAPGKSLVYGDGIGVANNLNVKHKPSALVKTNGTIENNNV